MLQTSSYYHKEIPILSVFSFFSLLYMTIDLFRRVVFIVDSAAQ